MDLTDAQNEAIKEIQDNALLHKNMKGRGHLYDMNGHKIVDARTFIALQDKGIAEWDYDWGYDDHWASLTEKGKEMYQQLDE